MRYATARHRADRPPDNVPVRRVRARCGPGCCRRAEPAPASPDPVGRGNSATEAEAWPPPCARGRRGAAAAAPGVGADASGRSVGGRPGPCGRTSLASARRDLSNPATDRADGPVDGGTNRILPAPNAGASQARSVVRPRSPRKLGSRRLWCPALCLAATVVSSSISCGYRSEPPELLKSPTS